MSDRLSDLLAHAVAYSWQWVDPDRPHDFTEIRIEGRRQSRDDLAPSKWRIQHEWGYELNRDGEWETPGLASSRDEDDWARTRWDSPEEALAFIEATLPGWASAGEMPCWESMRVAREAYFQRQRDRAAAQAAPSPPSSAPQGE